VVGTLIVDSREAAQKIEEMLAKEAVPIEDIRRHIERVKGAELHESVRLPGGLTTTTKPIESLQPDLAHPLADDHVFTLIALEYRFLVIGNAVLMPYFDPVAGYILGGDRPDYLTVQHFRGTVGYKPEHRVYLAPESHAVHVFVWLFGFHVYKVSFARLGNAVLAAPVYLEDLETGRSLWAISLDEARRGHFRSFGASAHSSASPGGILILGKTTLERLHMIAKNIMDCLVNAGRMVINCVQRWK